MTRVANKNKTTENRSWGLFNYASHADHVLNLAWDSSGSILEGSGAPSWAPLGRYLASFGTLLASSWSLLGACWVPLGRFLGALGRLWASLSRLLAAFDRPGPPQASILEGLGTCQALF